MVPNGRHLGSNSGWKEGCVWGLWVFRVVWHALGMSPWRVRAIVLVRILHCVADMNIVITNMPTATLLLELHSITNTVALAVATIAIALLRRFL